MTSIALPRPGPVARLSFGLISLIVSLVLAFDLFFGVLPTRFETRREVRNALASSIGVQAATLLERDDRAAVESAFAKTLDREREIVSLALRRGDGELVAQAGGHERHWNAPPPGKSTINHVRLPLYAGSAAWGDLELSFAPLDPYSLRAWLREPLLLLVVALSTAGLALVFLYMRRSLEFLDPTTAVPERVRQAFDAFADAVTIVDAKGRVVLANQAFRDLVPEVAESLYGRPLASLAWLARGAAEQDLPWMQAMPARRLIHGIEIDLPRRDGASGKALLACSPIAHDNGAARGCLVTLHDVTDLQRANHQLRTALHELELSRREIESKNLELQDLASRDGLTGCLNRRAFMEQSARLFETQRASDQPLACVMVDIDHFKSVNDRFGHSTGDQVIMLVAAALLSQLRPDDLLCRYGGEEFCVLLPDADAGQARAVAERLRDAVEANVGPGLRLAEPPVITASLGVADVAESRSRLEALINAADAALYESKHAGRNRVTVAA